MAKSTPTRLTSRKKGVVVSIESNVLILRRQKVILDTALAELYEYLLSV